MIFGTGIDIVQTSRFEDWIQDRKKLERYFSAEEIEYCLKTARPAESIAARFAAKEAFAKALGTGLSAFPLKDVAVSRADNGRPVLITGGKAASLVEENGICFLHVSLAHEKEYSIAQVILETKGN